MTIKPRGYVFENDGEVAVFVPLRIHGGDMANIFKDFTHAQTQRRAGWTMEEFRTQYPLMDEAEETKSKVLNVLGITQEEFSDAISMARSHIAESHNLLKLIRICREKREPKA